MREFRFRKEEKLTNRKIITNLWELGSRHQIFPIQLRFLSRPLDSKNLHQVLITIPVKHFKRSVDRNLLKRRIREAYRLNKHTLVSPQKYFFAYIYIAKEVLPSDRIHKAMQIHMEKLANYEDKA